MNPGDVYLGYEDSEIKLPAEGRRVIPGYIESVRADETASGRYVEDIIWRKKKWTINYEILQGEFLETLVELFESRQFLNLIICERDGSTNEYTVKMTLNYPERWKVLGPWVWLDGSIELRQVNALADS